VRTGAQYAKKNLRLQHFMLSLACTVCASSNRFASIQYYPFDIMPVFQIQTDLFQPDPSMQTYIDCFESSVKPGRVFFALEIWEAQSERFSSVMRVACYKSKMLSCSSVVVEQLPE
jgi:hypothetical protein